MSRPAHELRVIDEAAALYEKVQKLQAFLKTSTFQELEPMDRHLLTVQLAYMEDYHFTLLKRIKRFKPVGEG